MSFIVNESNNSFFNGNVTINKNYLVFPVNSTILTVITPLILSLIIYGFFIIFPESFLSSIFNSIYTFELAIFLGVIVSLLVCVYWYRYWKMNFNYNNVINITINKPEQFVEFTRDVGERKKMDSYKIHFDFLINLIIGRSADGNPDGWSLNLFIRNQRNKNKQDVFSVFIVNEEGIDDLYKFGLEIRSILEKMELVSLLRISDLFLKKVKEKQEKKINY